MARTPLAGNAKQSKSRQALVVQSYHESTDKQGVEVGIAINIFAPTAQPLAGTPPPTPLVFKTKKGNVATDSLKVAKGFGKSHGNVLQAIERLDCDADFRQMNFHSANYTDAQGKPRRYVVMTKRGFTFLVTGFTGKRAAQFKQGYIEQFERMQTELVSLRGEAPEVNLLDHSRREVQIASSQGINNYQYQIGGLVSVIQYNRENCLLHTGLRPSQIVRQAKADKLPAKSRSSAKEVLRHTSPHTACAMALADQLVQGGLSLANAAVITKQTVQVFAALLASGFQPSQLSRSNK